MSDQEQTQVAVPEASDNTEDGSLDQAVEAMLKRQTDQDASEATKPAEESARLEDEQDDPEAGNEKSKVDESVEVEYEGKAYRVPVELKDAVLRHRDYTQKTQEASAKVKTAEAAERRATEMAEQSEALAGVLADHRIVASRLKNLEAVDWVNMRSQDPAQYQLLAIDRQNLILEQQRIAERAKSVYGELSAKKQAAFAEKRNAMFKEVEKALPEWGDELGTKITKYAVKEGFTSDEIQEWTDARIVKLADKARRYDELQSKKPDVLKRASEAAKPLNPGAQRQNGDALKSSLDRLKRDGSLEAAAEAMFQREQSRRKPMR